jgi:dTDP-4-dehydrorhamnose 3,5-epimerase
MANELSIEIKPLKLPGTFEIFLQPRGDDRGYFMRVYDAEIFRATGLAVEWVQESQAFSSRQGVVRGLHFQNPPFAETKLVRVVSGAVLDVFVDLRPGSKSYGQWDAVKLASQDHKALYIPRGFAHGYCTLSDESLVLYKVDSRYAPEAEGGIRWNDPDLGIPWPVQNPIISAKDSKWPLFREFVTPFI